MVTRMSSKGQIVLPKSVREAHDWKAGVEFSVEDTGDGIVLRPARPLFPPSRLDDAVGCTGYRGPRRTLKEMDAAVMKEARRHAS